MNAKPGRKKSKNVSYFSHEYIIQNHGDIVSFVAMLIVLGLMFKTTAPVASMFIVMFHNVTVNDTNNNNMTMYSPGNKDFLACFFYTLICVVIHAVIQEYVLDKLSRKLHLSKTKLSKFNESGQLAVFYLVSMIWGINIIYSEKYITSLSSIWEGYPHIHLPFWVKFYFVFQICYWLHGFPELYFQKVKREEMVPRVLYTCLYLFAVVAAYVLHLTRFGLVLLVVQYFVEFLFHTSRLLYFANKTNVSSFSFVVWKLFYVLARLFSITLSYLTFFHGLQKTSQDIVNLTEGNFNTKIVSSSLIDNLQLIDVFRLNCFFFVLIVQAYLMWNFIIFQLRRHRERAKLDSNIFTTNTQLQKKKKKNAKRDEDDISDLPEVDQNQQKEIRQRKLKSK